MNSFLVSSEDRDQLIAWLEVQKEQARIARDKLTAGPEQAFQNGKYVALLTTIAYIKLGGRP